MLILTLTKGKKKLKFLFRLFHTKGSEGTYVKILLSGSLEMFA